MGKSDRGRAKDRANEAFSRYIRTRDAIRTTDTLEIVRCVTCGRIKPFKQTDCGHFVPGRSDSLLYDEHNAHGQCQACNRFKQGMWVEHEAAIREMYGDDEAERLKSMKLKPSQERLTEQDFKEITKYYRAETERLIKEFNDGKRYGRDQWFVAE